MDRLTQRLDTARQALVTMGEVVGQDEVSALVRDAAIQRFEYSFEATWKALQLYLKAQEGGVRFSEKRHPGGVSGWLAG